MGLTGASADPHLFLAPLASDIGVSGAVQEGPVHVQDAVGAEMVGGGEGGLHGADVADDESGVFTVFDTELCLSQAAGAGGKVLDLGGRSGFAAQQ